MAVRAGRSAAWWRRLLAPCGGLPEPYRLPGGRSRGGRPPQREMGWDIVVGPTHPGSGAGVALRRLVRRRQSLPGDRQRQDRSSGIVAMERFGVVEGQHPERSDRDGCAESDLRVVPVCLLVCGSGLVQLSGHANHRRRGSNRRQLEWIVLVQGFDPNQSGRRRRRQLVRSGLLQRRGLHRGRRAARRHLALARVGPQLGQWKMVAGRQSTDHSRRTERRASRRLVCRRLGLCHGRYGGCADRGRRLFRRWLRCIVRRANRHDHVAVEREHLHPGSSRPDGLHLLGGSLRARSLELSRLQRLEQPRLPRHVQCGRPHLLCFCHER